MIAKTLQDARGRDWFWLEDRLVDEGWVARLGVYAWAIYTILIRLSDDRGRAFPSTSELEKLSGVSRTMVKASLRKLILFHLLGRTRKGGPSRGSSVYRLSALPATEQVAAAPQKRRRSASKMEPSIDFELELFERAWERYPPRPGNNRKLAEEQWKKRRAEGHSGTDMLAGVGAYAALIETTGIQPQYVKMASTFFGPALHFLSDYSVAVGAAARSGRSTPADEVAAWNENEEVV